MESDTSAGPEHPDRDDDAEIEIGALRPSLRPPGIGDGAIARWLRQSVTLPRPVVAAGVLALVVLAALAILPGGGGQLAAVLAGPTATPTQFGGPTPTPTPIVTPTPSPFPTPTLVAPPLGPIPTNCAPSPTGPPVGGGGGLIYAAGSGPVWVNGFDGQTAIISVARDTTGPYSEYGWPVRIALALKHPFEQAVTLRGSDLRTGAALWFTLTNAGPKTGLVVPLITVDPQQSFDSIDSTSYWWNGMMYLPGAGCYTLQASWQGGGWQITFAAGQ